MALLARLWGGDRVAPARSEPEPEPPPAARTDNDSADLAARVRESLDLLEADLRELIGRVGRAADNVHDGIGTSRQTLDSIGVNTKDLSELAEVASSNVTVLAGATEQLAQSTSHIGSQVSAASRLTDEASEAAGRAGSHVDHLRESTGRIGSVVNLIAAIAKQTNLLALNARIEAARAGDAGKGFAVVAGEVKSLAAQTQNATAEISRQVEAIRRDAEESIETLAHVAEMLEQIQPLFATIASAVDEQVTTTSALSHNAADSSKFVHGVSARAHSIRDAIAHLTEESVKIDRTANEASEMTRTLATRLSIFLRQTEIGDRRRYDRLPCDQTALVQLGELTVSGRIVDLGEGGVLVEPEHPLPPDAKGAVVSIDLANAGQTNGRLVNTSHLGLHVQFENADPAFQGRLDEVLADIRMENHEIVEVAREAGACVATLLEEAVKQGRVSLEVLFDNRYEPIAGTNPQQYRTPYLALLEELLTPVQEKLLASDARMIFCAAVDRNAYLPVHNLKYSHPQRPDDVAWNIANCRNRRIFDDRAGLCAARNARPYVIQSYPRDMGTGAMVWMKEIDVPIRVLGRHWGGFRTAYRL